MVAKGEQTIDVKMMMDVKMAMDEDEKILIGETMDGEGGGGEVWVGSWWCAGDENAVRGGLDAYSGGA